MRVQKDGKDGTAREFNSRKRWSEETAGLWIMVLSALCYTISLSMLRMLTNYPEVSQDWSIAVKELTTVLCVSPIIIFNWIRGKFHFPGWLPILGLATAGVSCELFGARPHLMAYESIGVALTTPLIQSIQLVFLAIVGAMFLRERVTRSKVVAIILSVAAVYLLSVGANPQTEIAGRSVRIVFGVLCAACAASGYGVELAILRRLVRSESSQAGAQSDKETDAAKTKTICAVPTTLAMVVVTGMGVIVCGGFLTASKGLDGWIVKEPTCWACVLASGIANMFGFFLQIEGLKRLYVLKSSLIAALQTATLCLLGFAFFNEPFGWMAGLGVVLSLVAVLVSSISK